MKPDIAKQLGRLVERVVQNLENWEAASPDRNQIFVAMAGGGEHQGKTKTIHELVEDVRLGNPAGEELLGALLTNMMDQAMETPIGVPPPSFDATAFEAQLNVPPESTKNESLHEHRSSPEGESRDES